MIDADALLEFLKMTSEINDDAGFTGFAEAIKFHKKNALNFIEQRIKETATEPQERIFDAEGWCWDLSLINNDDEYHFLIESHRGGVGHKVTDKKSYYQLIGLTWFIDENLKENECLGDKIIAWRPLPTLPKDKP